MNQGLDVSVAMGRPLVGWLGVSYGGAPDPTSLLALCAQAKPPGEERWLPLHSLPWIPALPLTSWVISATFLNLSEPQFIGLKNEDAIYRGLA